MDDLAYLIRGHRHLINRRDTLYGHYKRNKTPYNLDKLRLPQHDTREAIGCAKNQYISHLATRLPGPETVPKEYHRICKRLFRESSAVDTSYC